MYVNSSNSECTEFAPVCSRRASSCSPLISASPQAGFCTHECVHVCSSVPGDCRTFERSSSVSPSQSVKKHVFPLAPALSVPSNWRSRRAWPFFIFPLSRSHVMCFKEVDSIALFLTLSIIKLSFYLVMEAERSLRLCLHLL